MCIRDRVEISQVQGVEWEQDGIYYNITAIDSPLDKQGLIDMAKEVDVYKRQELKRLILIIQANFLLWPPIFCI